MIAFISHSISETEQYILSLLAHKLKEQGFTLVTSYNQSDLSDIQTLNNIKNATLFIGLITNMGRPQKSARVYSEFSHATSHNKPSILLIEDSVPITPWVASYPNTIRFNRLNPHIAVDEVRNKIRLSQSSEAKQNSNAAAWILGGIAALALLSMLSDEK